MKNTPDTQTCLGERGVIFLWGPVDDGTAESVCRKIIETNVEGHVRHIQMLISSTGGSCQAGFAIIDMMAWSRLPIYTAGFGIVGSMAALIFAAGEKGHRVVTPATALLVHHFNAMGHGNYPELLSRRKYEDFLFDRVLQHLHKHSALKTENDVLTHLLKDSDTWLTPEETVRFGLADRIQCRCDVKEQVHGIA